MTQNIGQWIIIRNFAVKLKFNVQEKEENQKP